MWPLIIGYRPGMEGSGDNVSLLLRCQGDELNCITRYTDREVSILRLLRMSHSILKLLAAEYIYVEVMSTTIEVSVHSAYKVGNLLVICMTKSARVHGLSIGDTIQRPLVGDLGYGVQRCKKSACLCAVARVCTRCERSPCTTAIRKVTGELTVYNVGCDCKDGCCRLSTTICVVLLNICDDFLSASPVTEQVFTMQTSASSGVSAF